MKRMWKKVASLTLVLSLMLGLMSGLTIQAAAADPEVKIESLASGYTLTFDGKEKFELSFTGKEKTNYVVFLIRGNEAPQEGNIYYIDGYNTEDSKAVKFTIFPKTLATDTYRLYVTGGSIALDVKNPVAVINVKAGLLGDVTQDGRVNIMDVGRLYSHTQKIDLLTGEGLAVADVTGDGRVNIMDVGRLYAHVQRTDPLY